jgi:AcrR family transcriptional regulator
VRRVLTPADIDEFRARVCAAANGLVAELGEHGFNMRQLAGRLGVSAMTTYRYFEDKDEIIAAVRARFFARLTDRLEAVRDPVDSLEQTLANLSRVYVEFAREERAHFKAPFDLTQSRPGASELRHEEDRVREAFTTPLRLLAEAGLCETNVEVIGRMLWFSLHGTMALNLAGQLSDADRDRMISDAVQVLVRACGGNVEFRSRETQTMSANVHPSSCGSNGSSARKRDSAPASAC